MTLLTIPVLAAALAQPEPEPVVAPLEPTARVLVDRTLARRNVQLLALEPQSLRVIDEQGRTQTLPRAEVLAILPALTELDAPFVPEPRRQRRANQPGSNTQPAMPQVTGRLELSDGQVLPGTISTGAGKDTIGWNSKLWGSISVPLENTAAVVISPDRFDELLAGARSAQDLVLLRNGDRVEGFLMSVDATMVRLEKANKTSELPLARVDGILLANPVKPGSGTWAWVAGAAVAVSDISINDAGSCTMTGRLPGTKSQPSTTQRAEAIEAVCFDAALLRSLASMPFEVPTADDVRRWSQAPTITTPNAPVGASDIELPGPMRVEWTLPKGVTRFSTTLELPPSARLWGDCEVVVEVLNSAGTPTQIAKAPLNQATPQAVVNTPITGAAKLRVTVNPGPSGPIQDRVVIRRALLLMQP